MIFKSIIACLDMLGCPNRCKHCWLGHSPNGKLNADDLRYVAAQFRPFTERLTVDSWYREPDYGDDYKALWALCEKLSDHYAHLERYDHFELVSVWRLVRDENYAPWIASLGLKAAQLTLFGGRETTDFYTGRKHAYDELLRAIDILIENKISPRIQVFVNKQNIGELPLVEKLITDLDLENRCKAFGGKFAFFLHQGSCDGENAKLYPLRVTPDDLEKIPKKLEEYTLSHFGGSDISEVFGKTEKALCVKLISDDSTASYVSDEPVFLVDKDFNVYPNITCPGKAWLLGNLKTDGAKTVLENYIENKSAAQKIRATVPLSRLVRAHGDPESLRLFSEGDYIEYLVNKFAE